MPAQLNLFPQHSAAEAAPLPKVVRERLSEGLHVTVRAIPRGSPSGVREAAVLAWYELPELQNQTRDQFVTRCLASCEKHSRVEMLLLFEGAVHGAAVITPDEDLHVGKCLSVQWHYVAPAFRNSGFAFKVLRTLRNVAQYAGYRSVAYTHRVSGSAKRAEYRTKYITGLGGK